MSESRLVSLCPAPEGLQVMFLGVDYGQLKTKEVIVLGLVIEPDFGPDARPVPIVADEVGWLSTAFEVAESMQAHEEWVAGNEDREPHFRSVHWKVIWG